MSDKPGTLINELLQTYVEQHLAGASPDVINLCRDAPHLVEQLQRLVRGYHSVDGAFATNEIAQGGVDLPYFDGFRTIERVSQGGSGEVYKLEDLKLGRIVAAKVIRDKHLPDVDFLREARSLALFEDPRVVRLLEFRSDAEPPVLLMEYVDGFTLDRIGPSLEYPQRARVLLEIAGAIQHAHDLGIQHRDLKPANILVDARLAPKILDFGLSRGEPDRGHGIGTPGYMAPEQYDLQAPIDARADVFALGVILYELLSGRLPYGNEMAPAGVPAPLLPVEHVADVPEPLQAIALKAMALDPAERYATARDLAQDLGRYLDGRPVQARPTSYRSALRRQAAPHLEQIREWQRTNLIYPHEARALEADYARLEAREDDWILGGRALSFSQITLYLGAFFAALGGGLYFHAHFRAEAEPWGAFLFLALPFISLNVAGRECYRRNRQSVAIAFYLSAALLLPLFLLIVFDAAAFAPISIENANELFSEGYVSNRQLQIALLTASLWAATLALVTWTMTLSSCFTLLLVAFYGALLADYGLVNWLADGEWLTLGLRLTPLLLVLVALGVLGEWRGRDTAARPQYFAAAVLWMLIMELLAQDAKMFEFLGITLTPIQATDVSDPTLLNTLIAMTINGLLIYAVASGLERVRWPLVRKTSGMLFTIAPFATLGPLAWLCGVDEYGKSYDWLYLGLALAVVLLSHYRQRKSFYFAGLLNSGGALWFITAHNQWFDRPGWAALVIVGGLLLLAAGPLIHLVERDHPTA